MARPPVVIVDIDALRPDVLETGLRQGRLPNIARLFGGEGLPRGLFTPVMACAPSITFASQACLMTGAHPRQHGIPGSEFYDRFGLNSRGVPRHFAFDVGGTLAADDAVRVFTEGLAAWCLQEPTLYEQLAGEGFRSVVAGHMYARGASKWLPPSVVNLARLTKGYGLVGLSPAEFDRHILKKALDYLDQSGTPDLLVVYFLGVDSASHANGPQGQLPYLEAHLDAMIGELLEAVNAARRGGSPDPFWILCSDHGMIDVLPDDRHSIRLAFPFERELAPLFEALGLDVHDHPGEDPHSDAVVAMNGGSAQVYVKNREGRWRTPPDFERDILPVARLFWEAHSTGRYTPDLEGALAGVLVRNVAAQGWHTNYLSFTPQGELLSLDDWFARQPPGLYADPVNRLNNLAGPLSGDLFLISNLAEGFYFSGPTHGVHGGLHPEDSGAIIAWGWPGSGEETWLQVRGSIEQAIAGRCEAENGRQPGTADLWTGLQQIL